MNLIKGKIGRARHSVRAGRLSGGRLALWPAAGKGLPALPLANGLRAFQAGAVALPAKKRRNDE